MGDDDRRTSDRQIVLMQQKLDNHIEEYKAHCEAEEERWDHLIVSQERNTQSIRELTESTKALTDSTKDIVSAWQAANGTVKTMSKLGQFIKWVSGIVVLGAIAYKWIIDHYS